MQQALEMIPTVINGVEQAVKIGKAINSKVKSNKAARKAANAKANRIVQQQMSQVKADFMKRAKNFKPRSGQVGVASALGAKPSKYVRKYHANGDMTIEGSDYLSVVASNSNLNQGDVILTQIVSPLELAETRLQNECRNFESYFFENFSVEYSPTVASTTNGSLVQYYDMDVLEVPDTGMGEANIKRAKAHEKSVDTQVWERSFVTLPPPKDTQVKKYFTDNQGEDLRLSQQALYVLLAGSSLIAGSYGFLTVHYRVHFTNPQLAWQPVSGQAASITGLTGCTELNILGTAPIYNPQNSFKVLWAPTGTLRLSKGQYWIVINLEGTVISAPITPVIALPNTIIQKFNEVVDTNTRIVAMFHVSVLTASTDVGFTIGADTVAGAEMNITLLPTGMGMGRESSKLTTNDMVQVLTKLVTELAPGSDVDVRSLFLKDPVMIVHKHDQPKKITATAPESKVFRSSSQVLPLSSQNVSVNARRN